MAATFLLDTGPLGLLAHNRAALRVPIQNWLLQELSAHSIIFISEVADYEVRRELNRLIRANQLPASRLQRLDQLGKVFVYLSVSTPMWKRAADIGRKLWRHLDAPCLFPSDVLVGGEAVRKARARRPAQDAFWNANRCADG